MAIITKRLRADPQVKDSVWTASFRHERLQEYLVDMVDHDGEAITTTDMEIWELWMLTSANKADRLRESPRV